MFNSPHAPVLRRRVGALVVVAGLALSACGGSDDDATPAADPSSESATDTTDTADGSGVGTDGDVPAADTDGAPVADGEAPIQVGDDGSLEFSDEVDEVLSSVDLDTMMGIVADQLDPSPEVSIDGDAVTFTFGDGSVSGAWLPCSVAQTFLSDGQTLKVVYPDGDTMC